MKKISYLSFLFIFFYSCGLTNEEQMLYDYQQKNVSTLNFDLKDLEFKIEKIEKIQDITAADSMGYIKNELALNYTDNPSKSLIDTLSFEYVKLLLNEIITQLDADIEFYKESVLLAIQIDDYSFEYESKNKDDAKESKYNYQLKLSDIEYLEMEYLKLSEFQDSILSTKYIAKYSLNNPMLGNAKQTFEKYYYTNSMQTEFVKEEDIK